MDGVSNFKWTNYELEHTADEIILKIQNHDAYTETQIRRRQRQERDSLHKYITQNDPSIDSRTYLRHNELVYIIEHANLTKREYTFLQFILCDLTIREAGRELGVKKSTAYDMYNKVISKLRAVACDSPYNGLTMAYCDQISRYPAKRKTYVNYDSDNESGDNETI